jgi:Domain of unknown function (DUF4340)
MKRSTLLLIGILVILAITTYFVLQRPGETSSSGSDGELLSQIDSSAVDRLEISSPSGSVTLALEAGKWMITSPGRFRADQTAIAAAVGRGKRIELHNLVSTNPEKQKVFQVDSMGVHVRFYERGTQKASFIIGKPGPSWTETYVRRDGSTDVYLAEGPLSYLFAKQVKDWRDRTIFHIEENLIKAVRFRYGDTTFVVQHRDTLWEVDQSAASEATTRGFFTLLSNFQCDDFIDSSFAPQAAPNAVIDVEGTQIRFYLNKASGTYAVQTSQDSQWFSIQSWRASQILKHKREFLQTPT